MGLLLGCLVGPAGPVCATDALPLWQSHLSEQGFDRDRRLERAVSLSHPDSTIGAVVVEMAERGDVPLACAEDLSGRPMSAYLPPTRLKEMMAELASFTMTEWWREGDPPRYTLRKTDTLRKAEADLLRQWGLLGPASPEPAPEEVEAVAQRLREYAAALPLAEEQLVATYKESDPWIPACLLNPFYRGFMPFLTRLSGEEIRLLVVGQLVRRVADLPAGVRAHLERGVEGDFKDTYDGGLPPLYPAESGDSTQFDTWEERWAHAALQLSWKPGRNGGVWVKLSVPDTHTARPFMPLRAKHGSQGDAMWRVFRQTHSVFTLEQSEEMKAKLEPINRAESERDVAEEAALAKSRRLSVLRKCRTDWGDTTVLNVRVVPWAEAGRHATLGEVVVRIAAQATMPLLADVIGDASVTAVPMELTREQTVREALERVCRSWGGDTGWSKALGRFAWVKAQPEGRAFFSLASPSADLASRCDQLAEGKSAVTLEDFIALIGDLHPLQAHRALMHPRWQRAAAKFLLLLYLADAPTLHRLLAGDEVMVSDLDESRQQNLLLFARSKRPWVREFDLARATLAFQRIPEGGESRAVALLCEYHLPDDLAGRDVLYECPLSVPLDPLSAATRAAVTASDPTPADACVEATLAQTQWRFYGSLTLGKKRAAMLANNATGEMETPEEEASFRDLIVSSVTNTEVVLTDPAGVAHTLTLSVSTPSEPGVSDLPF